MRKSAQRVFCDVYSIKKSIGNNLFIIMFNNLFSIFYKSIINIIKNKINLIKKTIIMINNFIKTPKGVDDVAIEFIVKALVVTSWIQASANLCPMLGVVWVHLRIY